ncbi:YAP1-binding protein 2 [Pleurostoma richardsiae]|uniref:YAP1-binding protein 2 n=1 Tax=Pleurostoma richardsiae TaxID=41990 RepID=A0AA38RN62_9PEZI|nr:YAP1-binding protein 2 [Pleurostoma richardsiae]
MADSSKAIEALKESLPPATDRFTYLTIIEQFLSPDILPTLNDILQDAQLTQDIGWDLVDMLLPLPGCEPCLETVARLGNPREVILKVLEALEGLQATTEDGDEAEEQEAGSDTNRRFITLVGMLAILHKRIKTKHPSRFLASSLQTVYRTYRPNQEMTASVINLVHSLSAKSRPQLPSRKSSVNVANPDQDGNTSKNAPDPEAEQEEAPTEDVFQEKLLLSFVTCIIESYVNANDMEWSRRLLEFYSPDKLIPGKKTALEAFREDQELLSRDSIVGHLVAQIGDLGLSTCSRSFVREACAGPRRKDPLADAEDASKPDDIGLSTGGAICLVAYWAFSSTVFEANHPRPDMHLFPDHFDLLEEFMEDDAQSQISTNPGTTEALIAIGLWLEHNNLISTTDDTDFMSYHHHLTLCAVYHPSIHVRNAASTLAGRVLHADPDEDDRLKILEDLLENCMFASLKACAITWLREELVAARTGGGDASKKSLFSSPDAIEQLQYAVFPSLAFLKETEAADLLQYWAQNAPFILQAANFAYLLFRSDAYKPLVPEGMAGAVGQRFVEPLLQAAASLQAFIIQGSDGAAGDDMEEVAMQLRILEDRLNSLSLQ